MNRLCFYHRWRPRRSILLASWDAEEFNLGGSTEWGEDNELLLTQRAVAYLNVDVAVSGPGFWASATPTLDHTLRDVTKKVPWLNQGDAIIAYSRIQRRLKSFVAVASLWNGTGARP